MSCPTSWECHDNVGIEEDINDDDDYYYTDDEDTSDTYKIKSCQKYGLIGSK